MKILAIDTSGSNASVCLAEDKKVLCDMNLSVGLTHSETLLPMLETLQHFSHVSMEDIDVIAGSIGPGSFTGLRIGLATIKGFALPLEKKVIGVPTLQALAYNVSYFNGLICSVLDARNRNVYAGIYQKVEKGLCQQGDYFTESIDALLQTLSAQNEKVIFVGSGAVSYEKEIREVLGDSAYFAPVSLQRELASSVACLAYERACQNDFDLVDNLNPMYLKKSQAERMLGE